jgi:hypothetical protein
MKHFKVAFNCMTYWMYYYNLIYIQTIGSDIFMLCYYILCPPCLKIYILYHEQAVLHKC